MGTLLIHTPPLLLDTHTTRYTPLDTLTILQLSTSLESVKPKPTVMPLFTTELMDTTTDLHTPTTMVPHTLTEPTHTETFTEPGTEPLSRTQRHKLYFFFTIFLIFDQVTTSMMLA